MQHIWLQPVQVMEGALQRGIMFAVKTLFIGHLIMLREDLPRDLHPLGTLTHPTDLDMLTVL